MRCLIPAADLAQKLHNTVCMYDGKPVWVEAQRGEVTIHNLIGGEPKKINPKDSKFDISTPPLGYLEHQNAVLYLSRMPIRRSRQGLDERSLIARRIPSDRGSLRKQNNPALIKSKRNIFFSKGFVNMVCGIYPPLDKILEDLSASWHNDSDRSYEKPVSRDIALRINPMGIINVFLKNDLVGWLPPDGNIVQVPSSDKGWIVSRYLSHSLSWEIN